MSSVSEIETSKAFIGSVNIRRNVGDITDLAKSIQAKGILEPLVVRPSGNRYEVVVGSRRFEAAKAVGLKTIPVIVRKLSDEEAITTSLIENLQREDIEPEEEYDGLMALKRLNPKLYRTEEQLAKVIGKSQAHVADVIRAVEVIRGLRKEAKVEVSVRQAPTDEERKEGTLPLKHATFLHTAQEAATVQSLPKEERVEKLAELAETIAPMPQTQAQKVVSHFVSAPEKTIQQIKREVIGAHATPLQIYLEPNIFEALRKAAQDRGISMEKLAPIAIEEWLKQVGYLG